MLRVYLSGSMTIEMGGIRLNPRDFPGQQGRAAFAYLVGERHSPVSRATLAEAVWPDGPPPSWDPALSAVVSKLRSLLGTLGLDGSNVLRAVGGCYELHLPPASWVDHEVAADSVHEAEAALRAEDPAAAYGPSAIAQHIARRPFLPGEHAPWIEQKRDRLESILSRALECRAQVYLWNREYQLAVEAARDLVDRQPFREAGYRFLMRAHAAAGNSAEALRVYESCRRLLSAELGVSPSPETRAVHADVLRGL